MYLPNILVIFGGNMVVGIICEYNPLHNGHIRHIKMSREAFNSSDSPCVIVCAMSGNFTQRGDIAINDKFTRAAWAIHAGADIVLEIPPIFATSGAKYFAKGGVETLLKFKGLSAISFGAESADTSDIIRLAQLESDAEYNRLMREGISCGLSYPVAHSQTCKNLGFDIPATPNNMLGAEYINALKAAKREDIIVHSIKRDSSHHSPDLSNANCSSSAIRTALNSGDIQSIEKFLPSDVYNDVINSRINYNKFFAIIALSLLTATKVYEDNEGVLNRVKANINKVSTVDELIAAVHTKRYTHSRIRRILTHIALEHTAITDIPDTVRVLAVNSHSRECLSQLPLNHSSQLDYEDKIYNIVSNNKIKSNSMLII